ncbi:MAG: carboxymuconolactone decarboxylase family protein [Phycisphaerales bacterium]|nr:carboxymuconolactone decarboxylase family protein [Phycisphaerales bacterium]
MRVEVSDDQLAHAFDIVKDDPCFAESVAAMKAGKRPGEMLQALALRPELLAGFSRLGEAFYPGGIVERDLKELVILESSRRNACQFCTGVHVLIARMMGIGDDPLRLLDEPEQQTERQRLALEYTRAAMDNSNKVSDELFKRLKTAFTDAEIVEITFLIGNINCLNLFNNCLRVSYHGEYENQSD